MSEEDTYVADDGTEYALPDLDDLEEVPREKWTTLEELEERANE